jgi:signal transduction histidine kinase
MRPFGRFRTRVLGLGLTVVVIMATAIAIADRVFVNSWVKGEIGRRRAHVTNQVSFYGTDGSLLASNIDPPLPAPSAELRELLARRHESTSRGDLVMTCLFQQQSCVGVTVRRLPPPMEQYPGPPLSLVLLTLGACMGVTLLVSIPLARSVVQPVEALSHSVRLFGSGQLSTRVSLRRGDELGELAAAFDEMAARIEGLVLSEKQLLANVSHELRTPLSRIRVVLELASDGDPMRVGSYLGEIARDLQDVERLLDDVLATARLDFASGRISGASWPLHKTTANLGTIVDGARARFEQLYPGRKLELVAGGELPDLECDPNLLRRMVDNLLDNAVKYANQARLELSVSGDAQSIHIRVADDGPGMSKPVAERAFEPFFRADESRDRRSGGVGLGLSIVRSIVEAHGGQVQLVSAPGKGTQVTARIPRRADVVAGSGHATAT